MINFDPIPSPRPAYPAVRAGLVRCLADRRSIAAFGRELARASIAPSDLAMGLEAMAPTVAGESPAGARQRREYAPRGSKQVRYAARVRS